MKNKPLTYVLLLVVVVVWGMIIYRVFVAVSANDGADLPQPIAAADKKEAPNDYAPVKDTTKLMLNYRDPFGAAEDKDTAVIAVNKLIKMPSMAARPFVQPINWGFIRYSGYIVSAGSKKPLAMLSINGRNVTLAEGEQSDNVKLLRNAKDSVKVAFQGKTKFIKISQ